MTRKKLGPNLQAWVDARKRYHLSHAQVQMARELGMNPRKLGMLANHAQEPWKLPLPQYIEHLYARSFGRSRPAVVMSIEKHARLQEQKKIMRREIKRSRALAESYGVTIPERKISETILEFGEPLLAELDDEAPLEVMLNLLQIVVTVWNAHVMAMPLWGQPEHLRELENLAHHRLAPTRMKVVLDELSTRRRKSFADDPRLVGEWNLISDDTGGYRFRCAAMLPRSVGEHGTRHP